MNGERLEIKKLISAQLTKQSSEGTQTKPWNQEHGTSPDSFFSLQTG